MSDIQGRLVKSDSKQRYTLGIVYEPDTVDLQGDFADATTIEKACWDFTRMLQGQRKVTKAALELLHGISKALEGGEVRIDVTELMDSGDIEKKLGDMHTAWDDSFGDIVECYVAPCDFELNGEKVKKGSWLLGVVWSEDYFKKIESGERTGFSMGGRGRRVPVG